MLLVRIVIGKVRNKNRLWPIFRRTPLRPHEEGWNSVAWAKEAFEDAVADTMAIGTCVENWEAVRDKAMWYVEKKKAAHRFDGQAQYDLTKVPTWDMLRNKELVA